MDSSMFDMDDGGSSDFDPGVVSECLNDLQITIRTNSVF